MAIKDIRRYVILDTKERYDDVIETRRKHLRKAKGVVMQR